MANRFKIQVLMNADPDAAYAAITEKDACTLYILKNGKGYFGSVQCFGEGASTVSSDSIAMVSTTGAFTPEANKLYAFVVDGITVNEVEYPQGVYSTDGTGTLNNITYKTIASYIAANAVKDMTTDGYTGDDTTFATTKAIVDYVTKKTSATSQLTDAVFEAVEVTGELTEEEITNKTVSVGGTETAVTGIDENTHVGDVGLVFTTSNDDHLFINLHSLINLYDIKSDTLDVTSEVSNHKTTFTVNVKKADTLTEENLIKKIQDGTDALATGSTFDTTDLSDNKFVSEKQLADIISAILKDYTKYTVNE